MRRISDIRACAAAILLLLAGCATGLKDYPAGTIKPIRVAENSAVIEQEAVSVTPLPPEEPPSPVYTVGPGDVLYVNVSGRAELGSPTGGLGSKVQGSRVDGNGNFRLPLVGSVQAGGRTVDQIQTYLTEAFAKYLKEPWVVVEVAEYRSKPIYLLGQFKAPGTYYLERPLTLIQGIALGSGIDTNANLRAARLIRDKRTLPVDVYAVLREGDQGQNPWLKPGDTVYIPDMKSRSVFVFGAVERPGAVQMPEGPLTLPQAVAAAGLRRSGYDLGHVRIIRSLSATRGQLIVADVARMLNGDALPFSMAEGDIVYVPRNGFGTWNDAMNDILPSLQVISGVLQPFVQIKFLSRDNN